MRDPISELRSLDGDVPATPLPPAEVRRRGDRMRRRRATAQVVAAAAAVTAVVSGGLLLTGPPPDAPRPPVPPARSPSDPAGPEQTPHGGSVTTIPEDVARALRRSLPAPTEGAQARTVTDTALPWQSLPCGDLDDAAAPPMLRSTWFAGLDQQRTDQRFEVIDPPAEVHARQLVVYADEETAAAVVQAVREQAESCGPLEALPGITELRWSVSPLRVDGADSLLLAGGEFTLDSGVRTPSRALLTVVRRGNAVLVAQLSDESSAPVDDLSEPGAAQLVDVTRRLARKMCAFTVGGCQETAPSSTSSPAGTPAAEADLSEEHLLTADEIPFTSRFSFDDTGSTDGPVSRCAQDSWSGLGASSVLRRDFVVPGRPIETRTAVAQFPDEETAQAVYDRIQRWIDSCPATLRGQGFDRASIVEDRWRPDYPTPGARGTFAELDYGPAPEELDPRGEMGYFQSDGVVLVGNRLSWLSLTAVDVEWHFSHDPQSPELTPHPFFTAMPRAAERLADG